MQDLASASALPLYVPRAGRHLAEVRRRLPEGLRALEAAEHSGPVLRPRVDSGQSRPGGCRRTQLETALDLLPRAPGLPRNHPLARQQEPVAGIVVAGPRHTVQHPLRPGEVAQLQEIGKCVGPPPGLRDRDDQTEAAERPGCPAQS